MKNIRMNEEEIYGYFKENNDEVSSLLGQISKHKYVYFYGHDMFPQFCLIMLYLFNECNKGKTILIVGKDKKHDEILISGDLGANRIFKLPKNAYKHERYSNISKVKRKFDSILLIGLNNRCQNDLILSQVSSFLNERGQIFIHDNKTEFIESDLKQKIINWSLNDLFIVPEDKTESVENSAKEIKQ